MDLDAHENSFAIWSDFKISKRKWKFEPVKTLKANNWGLAMEIGKCLAEARVQLSVSLTPERPRARRWRGFGRNKNVYPTLLSLKWAVRIFKFVSLRVGTGWDGHGRPRPPLEALSQPILGSTLRWNKLQTTNRCLPSWVVIGHCSAKNAYPQLTMSP